MENNTSTNLLNSSQVYRTKILVENLRKSDIIKTEYLIKLVSKNRDNLISYRTLKRDIELLKENYGIIIKCRRNSGYYLDEEKSNNIDSFLSHMEVLITGGILTSSFKERNDILNYVYFENNAEALTIPNFKSVLDAIQANLPITFKHFSFYHLKEEIYTLKPYFLKQYQNRWYVVGETEKGYRTFGIDRIENITMGTKKFKPKTEAAKDKFSHVVGLNYADHKLEKIHLSFDISQKPYLLSLPIHRTQKEISTDNSSRFDIELLIHPNFEFKQQILKYGSLVKVVEPKWLAEEVKDDLKKGFENY